MRKRDLVAFCLPEDRGTVASFFLFRPPLPLTRTRGDLPIFPTATSSRVPTFRRGFFGNSVRGRKQKGRRPVKSNSANVHAAVVPSSARSLSFYNSFAVFLRGRINRARPGCTISHRDFQPSSSQLKSLPSPDPSFRP